jgi:hypothetical protein
MKTVPTTRKYKVEIMIMDGQGGGTKLFWCDINHFKIGGKEHLKEYTELLHIEMHKADFGRLPLTVICKGCKQKCSTKLRLSTQQTLFFCIPECVVVFVSSCGVSKWKDINK